MADAVPALTEKYSAIVPALNETLENSTKLLPLLAQIPPQEKEEIIRLTQQYPPQPDIAIAGDIIAALPNQLRSVIGLASFFDTMQDNKRELNNVEKDFAALPWNTIAEFRGAILALHQILKFANKTAEGNQAFSMDNLLTSGKYDETIALTGAIAGQSWPIQQFVQQNQEEISNTAIRYQHERKKPATEVRAPVAEIAVQQPLQKSM